MSVTHQAKTKALKGYRLHDARIDFSGGQGSMRSIKYELVDLDDSIGLRDTISEYVISDSRFLYGNINLNDYLTAKQESPLEDARGISFLGLWLKALSLGFIFSKQSQHISSDFKKLIGQKPQGEIAFANLPLQWREKIDQEAWCRWWKSTKKPAKLDQIFLKDFIEDFAVQAAISSYNQNPKLKCNAAFRCKLFNIDESKVPNDSAELDPAISWACDPNFPVQQFANLTDRTQIIDKIIEYYKNKGLNPAQDKDLSHLLGLYGPNQTFMYGFVGNFFTWLKSRDLADQAHNLAQAFAFSHQQEKIIYERLLILRDYASTIPERPKLVESWSSYRVEFGGTLESWYSNYLAKRDEARLQIMSLLNLLEEIRQHLPEDCAIRDDSLKETIDYAKTLKDGPNHENSVELEVRLAQLRSELNQWCQQHQKEALRLREIKLDDSIARPNWQKELGKRIQSSPLFFGEAKFESWEKIYNLKSKIADNIKAISQALQHAPSDTELPPDRMDRLVDALAQLYQRIYTPKTGRLFGSKRILESLNALAALLETDFSLRDDFHRYSISGYSRFQQNRSQKINYTPCSLEALISASRLPQLLKDANSLIMEENYLRDLTQLSKILVSAKLYDADSESQRQLLKYHSDLWGCVALLSKRSFIAKYQIQAINGEQSIPGIYYGRSKKGNPCERYCYIFKYVDDSRKTNITRLSQASPAHLPAEIAEPKDAKNAQQVALALRSSKYQLQFMDWFFEKIKSRKTTLQLNGSFLIAEKNVKIDWRDDYPKIVYDSQPYRLFVSQPFTIVSANPNPPKILPNRYIGIDIGEYGLAWALIEVSGRKVAQLASGFISDPQQDRLRKTVTEFRNHQVRQTFSSPNTQIARIRESLIGSYRNQLEDLVLRYQARLCFEFEVSAFESGGSRISKIYDSIKRGDINRSENKPQLTISWGLNPFSKQKSPVNYAKFNAIYGFENTAAGTSQFCTKCKRWASLAIDDKAEYVIEDYHDKLYRTKVVDGCLRFLGRSGDAAGKTISGKELRSQVYLAMRPNAAGLGMQIVERRHPDYAALSKIFGQGKARGNIGIFVCPYTDCHHISDADLQAAFNIAVRGFIKDEQQRGRLAKKGNRKLKLTKELLCTLESELKFSPIDLTVESAI